MAVLELNALSTTLSGSFSATVFFPNQSGMQEECYPALYFIHDIGGDDTDLRILHNLEQLVDELRIFVICPSLMHSFGMNLPWGGKYGDFVCRELPGICSHMFPLDGRRQFLGGIGKGAYGAYWNAAHSPEIFSKCLLINGCYDMAGICEAAADGTPIPNLTIANLEAVFGNLKTVRGSDFDILHLEAAAPKAVFLGCEENFPGARDSLNFAKRCKTSARMGASLEDVFEAGLHWLCDEREDYYEKN